MALVRRKTPPLTARQQTLLGFLYGGDSELDPIRIMKGLFLISKETPKDWLPTVARYTFQPYHYGPYAPEVYSDLRLLEELGLVNTRQESGQSWRYYLLTDKGESLAKTYIENINPKAVNYFGTINDFVSKLPFRSLLEAIYKKYPQFAINSVFKH